MTHISDIIEEEVVAMQDWLDYLVKAGYINAKFDVRSFAHRIAEAARKDIPIEHCGEKDCPECNLAAFEAGKKEGAGEALKRFYILGTGNPKVDKLWRENIKNYAEEHGLSHLLSSKETNQ